MTETQPRPLTGRQSQTYEFVRAFFLEHGYSPPLRLIAAHMGMSGNPSGPLTNLRALTKKGWMKRVAMTGARPAGSGYVPTRPELVATVGPESVTVAMTGPGVTFTREEWRAWLEARLCELGGY